MKTLYVTNVPSGNLNDVISRFEFINTAKPKPLPAAVQHEKLYQALMQISLLGYNQDGYGFYETSLDKGRLITLDDPVGSISVRIDYDPNCVTDEPVPMGHIPDWLPHDVFSNAIMALCNPNSHPHFPELALIDHIRVAIKVTDDVIIERTYWATQYYLLKGLPGTEDIFGNKEFDPAKYM